MASKAYNFMCMGIGSALRMGLHVYSESIRKQFTPHELTQRRRVFAVLNYTQAYLASVLGMPFLVKDADPEQILAVPEEDLHDEGKSLMLNQPVSRLASTIHLCKLFRIAAEITKNRSGRFQADFAPNGGYSLRHEGIAQWERRLSEWREDLPALTPDIMDQAVLRAQLILRFVDTCIVIAMYRPFMQHVVRTSDDPDFDAKGQEYSSACIRACIRAVQVAEMMDEYSVLHVNQWYVTYNLAIATSSLMLVVLGNQDGIFLDEAKASEVKAAALLEKLGRSSRSARKCSESLSALRAVIQVSQSG